MAVSVRIEDEAFGDERYEDLANIAGLADADHARGKMARLWRQCTLEHTYYLPIATVVRVLGPRAIEALEASRLGEKVDDQRVRIRGTEGRIEWLQKLRNNGKFGKLGAEHGRKGGRPRKTPPKPRLGVSENPPPAPAPVPAPTEELSPARTIPLEDEHPTEPPLNQSTSDPRSPRQIRLGQLVTKAWNLAAAKHRELKGEGIDSQARNCWSGTPNRDQARLLLDRLEALTACDEPDWDQAWEVVENRILVAAAEAKHRLKHLGYFTPARLWARDSFAIGSELSPQQAARDMRPARGAMSSAPVIKFAARDDDAPPPTLAALGGSKP